MMGDEREMRQRRAGRDHFCPGDVDAGVRLLGHARVDVRGPAGRAGRHVAVDRRMDDRVIDERHALLREAIPAPRVGFIGRVELRVRSERPEKRRLVVGRASAPAVGEARPRRDRVASRELLRRRRAEVAVREPALLGGLDAHAPAKRVVLVQRIVETGEHSGPVYGSVSVFGLAGTAMVAPPENSTPPEPPLIPGMGGRSRAKIRKSVVTGGRDRREVIFLIVGRV